MFSIGDAVIVARPERGAEHLKGRVGEVVALWPERDSLGGRAKVPYPYQVAVEGCDTLVWFAADELDKTTKSAGPEKAKGPERNTTEYTQKELSYLVAGLLMLDNSIIRDFGNGILDLEKALDHLTEVQALKAKVVNSQR